MSEKKTVSFLTQTAMGIALVIAAQLAGKSLPAGIAIAGPFSVNQLVTGSLVNCVLFVFTAMTGTSGGVLIGICSAVLASLIGVGPAVLPVVPLIACGNALLCLLFGLFRRKIADIPAVLLSAAGKCAFLWILIPRILQVAGVPEKQQTVLSVMFSWPQFVTALIGGILALAMLKRLKKIF